MLTTPLYFIVIIIFVNHCPFIKQGLTKLQDACFPSIVNEDSVLMYQAV